MVFRIDIVLRLLTLVLLLAAAAVGIRAWQVAQRAAPPDTAEPAAARDVVESAAPPVREPVPEDDWQVFVGGGDRPAPVAGQHERYRLAGTFFLMGSNPDGTSGQRLAIIDDVSQNRQHIVSEGMSFDEHEILRIQSDRLIMRRDGLEIELALSFQGGIGTGATARASASTNETAVEEIALETSRFGKRIGEARWVMQKDALFAFYQELLDNPERIAAIYSSMKPDLQDGEIAGYRLEKEGENEFFDAVGLQEGDRIRRVNSMRMTSQARAEYFIGEFMKNRLGAVVIDIERNGNPEKLIYLFR